VPFIFSGKGQGIILIGAILNLAPSDGDIFWTLLNILGIWGAHERP
jgi:hypothetical protein